MRSRLVPAGVILVLVAVGVLVFSGNLPVGATADPAPSGSRPPPAGTPPQPGPDLPALPEAEPRDLIGVLPPVSEGVALVVTDARTGSALTHGSLLVRPDGHEDGAWRDGSAWRAPPDGFTRVLLRDAAFPAELSVRGADPVVWIGSDGYAWRAAQVSEPGTAVHVALEPAGNLTLRFAEELSDRRPPGSSRDEPLLDVELRHEGHRLVGPDEFGLTFSADPGDVRLLGDVPSGSYELTARVSSPLGVGHAIARQTFEVAQGGGTTVRVVPTDYDESATLTLFLELDGSGDRDELLGQSVRLFQRGGTGALEIVGFHPDPEWTEVAPDRVWEVSYPGLTAGTYEVFLDPSALAQEVVLTAGEESTLHFELTELVTVSLDVTACTVGGQGAGLIWGYQENARRLRKYVVLAPGDSVVRIECVARPMWVQVVGSGLASGPVFFNPSPLALVESAIACAPERAAAARVAVIPGARSPSPDSREFWDRVRLRGTSHEGLMHSILRRPVPDGAADYPGGAFLGTLVFDEPGEYEMEYAVQWGTTARAHITAGADPSAVVELRLD